jgi:hypothetical protein
MAKVKAPERQFLSRSDMEKTIKEGGSVIHKGEHITRVEDLPTDTDLAIGDESAEDTQMRRLEEQQKALEQEKTRLAKARADRALAMKAQEKAAAESEEAPAPRRGKKPGPKRGAKRKAMETASAGPGARGASEEADEGDGGGEEAE